VLAEPAGIGKGVSPLSSQLPEQRGQRWHDRRTAIVDAAARLFAERGYHATGTAELCQAVGLGKGSLYYYVESKENLLYLIHDRVMGQVFDTATRIAGLDEPAAERLRQLGREQISVIARYPDHVWVFLHEFRALTGERAAHFTASRRRYERSIEKILQDGVDSGEFVVDDVHLAALGWLGMHNYTYIWFQPGKRLTAARLATAFYDLFVQGISAPARSVSAVSAAAVSAAAGPAAGAAAAGSARRTSRSSTG
jgi:TetR/AcrR family transcriptional regulator, cholesterol catabolism regulator